LHYYSVKWRMAHRRPPAHPPTRQWAARAHSRRPALPFRTSKPNHKTQAAAFECLIYAECWHGPVTDDNIISIVHTDTPSRSQHTVWPNRNSLPRQRRKEISETDSHHRDVVQFFEDGSQQLIHNYDKSIA
jgi:hypothetical protein